MVKGGIIFCEATEFQSPCKRICRQSQTVYESFESSNFPKIFAHQRLWVPQILQVKTNSFQKWCWYNWISACKKKLSWTPTTQSTKVNSRAIIDLKVRGKTIKLVKESITVNLCDLGLSSVFFCFALFYKFILFVYFWLHWVFVAVHGLSLVAVSGGYSSLWCAGFLWWWLLLLRSTGSRRTGFSSCGSRALEHKLSSCGARA